MVFRCSTISPRVSGGVEHAYRWAMRFVRKIDFELRREIFERYNSGESFSEILAAYSDRELDAANLVATLPVRDHVRRCRLVVWFVASCFAIMALLCVWSLFFGAGKIVLLFRLAAYSAISICLFRIRLWGFLGALGILLASILTNLRHLAGGHLTESQEYVLIADSALNAVLAAAIFMLKRRIFPYYGIHGPKTDEVGKPIVLLQRSNDATRLEVPR
jgi:hypothetical protein